MGFSDFVKFRSEDYKLMHKYYPNSSAFKAGILLEKISLSKKI